MPQLRGDARLLHLDSSVAEQSCPVAKALTA
jgi:hypothetical protein